VNNGAGMDEMHYLGHQGMDTMHEELVELLHSAAACRDSRSLTHYLDLLIEHSRDHFAKEEAWMAQAAFPMITEHRAEHRQLLGEMEMMRRRLRPLTLPLVLSYVRERMPEWLMLHLQRMDSLLAAHLINSAQQQLHKPPL
jgi:hemerythrin